MMLERQLWSIKSIVPNRVLFLKSSVEHSVPVLASSAKSNGFNKMVNSPGS